MRLIPTALVATALMMMAAGAFYYGQFVGGAAFLAGSAVLFFRFASGDREAGVADVQSTMDFIRDPAGSIVDAAFDRLPGSDRQPAVEQKRDSAIGRVASWLSDDGSSPAEQKPFDADAALARYMASRPDGSPALETSIPQASARGFGRKGL